MQQKIVFIGGPGTGKTSVINELIQRGFHCKQEISREVTLQAQKEGIEQLFLTNPMLFSEKLLAGREQQFIEASNSDEKFIFFDRGIPDIAAYMNYFNTAYPDIFNEKSKHYQYDKIFLFAPWPEIYTSDNERYESFEEAVIIHRFLEKTYTELGYTIIHVPFGAIADRTDYIVHLLKPQE